ncbi:aspartyl/asparaginyl beta-hydroxylase isoform X3 [Drosophila virilis]|uniref:aspartyl/asparaginyl beta-hydroxylase isoform X3 n=1 Tax=Drosophila virilis TaxID=7244 RepID=UPI0013965A08|nr:aspartyl/asparaginyl beta-hydroxylase isoform X3 [Drosophila virilis]
MSGDVQPRKRKDKRKKRDERKSDGDVSVLRQPSFQDDEDSSSHGVHITKMGNDDVHLHVQQQHGTGGHWCAKIIFFSLMAVLLGLVGLIIMENRGLEDLDTPLSESRYSNYFDGWVEEHRQEEHDAHHSPEAALDEHDDEHDEEPDEAYDQHSGEEEEDHEADEEEEEAEEDENTGAENLTAEDDEDDDDEARIESSASEFKLINCLFQDDDREEEPEASVEPTQSVADDADENDEEEEDADDEVEESIEPPVSRSRAQSAPETVEEDDDDDIEEEEEEEDADEEELEESIEPTISQSQAQSAPEKADDDNDDDDDEYAAEEDEEPQESIEPAQQSAPDVDDDDDDEDFEQDDNDEDEFESLDQEVDNEAEERQRQAAAEARAKHAKQDPGPEDTAETITTASWLGSLAVKFGVGIALALVSRLVLIRKNPNTTEDQPSPEMNLRRRLTIATAEDNLPDDGEELPPLDDDEYSEEEIEIEEEIEVEISDLEESDDNVAITASYVPETFEQLSAMFRPKTELKTSEATETLAAKEPEPEPTTDKLEQEAELEPEATTATDIYVEYEDGDIEDYEHDESDDELISDEEEDEISDVDDAELMSRLEAKYGRLPAKEYESDPDSDDPTWTQIKPKQPTGAQSAEDDLFEQQLRQANAEMINENYAKALRDFNTLTHTHAHKPAAHLHRARALERLAKLRQSNQLLLDAIESYKRYLAFEELIASDGVGDSDYRAAGVRCIQHLRFLGRTQQAVGIHEQLLARYPDEAQLRNELSLSHLMSNNLVKLQQVAAETLERWPHDPQAQLHFGLALKQLGGDYAGALPYLQRAIDSGAAGTQEPYFYLALGETLQRLGRQTQALQLYRRGADRGFFASVYQRSLYNVPGLRAQPFWQPAETGQAAQLEQLQRNWRAIRAEALALLGGQGNFQLEAEQLRDTGNWQQFELYARGKRLESNCQRAPVTCALLDRFPAASSCRRGQIKFSAMQAQTHVWPHCGPTNCRLRAHLTLVAPEPQLTSLRVAEHQRTWQEGDLFIFDDSFEHEVWHNGTQLRLVLIVDLWHPDLSAAQRRSLTAI